MKKAILASAILFSTLAASAQRPQQQIKDTDRGKNSYQTGKIYGDKVDIKTAHPIGDLDKYMGHRVSVTTTVLGRVVKVEDQGKTFMIKDDQGKMIPVHFAKAGFKVPQSIKGKKVLVDGVISKQFIADDHQHFAGSKPGTEKNVHQKTGPNQYVIAANGVQIVD